MAFAQITFRESLAKKLIPTGEVPNLVVTIVTSDTTAKLFGVDPLHQLGVRWIGVRSLQSTIREGVKALLT